MVEHTFKPGEGALVSADSPDGRYSAFFEDSDDVGYFYALDLSRSPQMVVDAVHVYNVADVVDRDRPSTVSIVWAENEPKCALLINDYPHAAFDFSTKRGYCRTNFPNFPDPKDARWHTSDHTWSDDAVAWLIKD